MTPEQILARASATVLERRQAYGDPKVVMSAIAARWSITLGQPVTPAQVVLCMIDLKVARLTYDATHLDSAVDVIGYAALLPEAAR